MECSTFMQNVTDLLSDGKTPYERRVGKSCEGPIITFGSFGCVSSYACEGHVSEIHSQRLNAKEVIFPKKENLLFQSQMYESKHLQKIRN